MIVTLRPFAPVVQDGATVTGAGAVWADDNPATFVTLPSSSYAWAYFAEAPEVSAAISATLRFTYTLAAPSNGTVILSATPPVGAAPGYVGIDLATFAGTALPTGSGLMYTHPLTEADFDGNGTSFAEFLERFVSGGVAPWGDGNVSFAYWSGLVVHEVYLDFLIPDTTSTPPPPLVLWPRDDDLGSFGVAQFFPQPSSEQSSPNRGSAGAYL